MLTQNKTLQKISTIEHKQLTDILLTLPVPQKRYLKAALNTAVFWVFSLAAFCILWFISSLLVASFSTLDIGISSQYAIFIFPTAIVLAAIFAINSTRKWLAESDNLYTLVKADLKAQQVCKASFKVMGVKCFKEPEHGGVLYCLLLQTNSVTGSSDTQCKANMIRVIYDYQSQQAKIDPTTLLKPSDNITIITAPQSLLVLDNIFEGERLADIKHFALTLPPEKWPKPDSWLDEDWQELENSYSA
ncbi:hypothetical protein [Psychromonas sp. SR45-3]|uniref:hypothetical protein n=1 Tax=Psychromonas sp. SR45-3 TaxID=2760930 RepID=UPI0015FAC477|nr:hypothetical protein [Psychromonas sp. SR45-3]MBB1272380.1 hypothetical protein [Psychromonas sp. SR45-3]